MTDSTTTKPDNLAERFKAAIDRIEPDHDFGIIWDYDDRKAGVTCGPNCLSGFPYANGEGRHLDRFEALVIAAEAAALASENRHD